jgi:hypothetical protein
MMKAGRLVALFLALTGVTGCGESPHLLTHDLLVFWNEFKLLGKKHENLKERFDKSLKDMKRPEAIELEDALIDYYDEIVATETRLKNCQLRLQKIIDVTPNHDELAKVRDWPNSKKIFHQVPLLDFTPRKGDANYPKQFGTGLVPMRPQLIPPKGKF